MSFDIFRRYVLVVYDNEIEVSFILVTDIAYLVVPVIMELWDCSFTGRLW